MECPRCAAPLARKKLRDREGDVDQCTKCGGVWFDDGELAQLVGGRARLTAPPNAAATTTANCPRCSKAFQRFAYPGTMTLIDRCSTCAGVWLDGGELQEIRKARATVSGSCPKCGAARNGGESCLGCGVVYQKAGPGPSRAATSASAKPETAVLHQEIGGVKGSLIRFIDSTLKSIWGGLRQ